MSLFNFLHRYPYLRLLLPFIIGILLGDALAFRNTEFSLNFAYLTCGFSAFICLLSFFFRQYSLRCIFGLGIYLFFFSVGILSSACRLKQVIQPFPQKEVVYRGVVTDHPNIKEHSVSCRMRLLGRIDSLSTEPLNKKILLYFSKDSASQQLDRGDELLFYACLSAPQNKGNPNEFDYGRYLLRKGISGTGFVFTGYWKSVGHNSSRSLKEWAMDYRRNILNMYRSLNFGKDNQAILSALTVGYKDDLSEELKETYSIAGASHVLALSGLHIGLLYLVLLFALRIIPGRSIYIKTVRFLILTSALWTFAFLTGLSPSVVRSVIMFTLFALSELVSGKAFSMNSLCVAALFMLLYNPFWLFDVGFQLSFTAVTAILILYPIIYEKFKFSNWLANKIWSLIALSFAAQIGTAPLVIFYFHRYSTHFLLTNLLVIPLVTLIMYLAVALLLFFPLPFFLNYIKLPLRWCLDLLNLSVDQVEKLPFSSIDHLWLYPQELWGIYLSVLFLLSYLMRRNVKYMFAFLLTVLFLCVYHAGMLYEDRPRESILFYNVHNCPVAQCITPSGQSWLVTPDSLSDVKALTRAASPYWDRLHLSTPELVSANKHTAELLFHNNILSFCGRRICFVEDARWKNKVATHPLLVDYLYLCKGYKGRLVWLTKLFSVQTVILDTSITEWHKQELTEECRKMGIHFISLSIEGSACFLL